MMVNDWHSKHVNRWGVVTGAQHCLCTLQTASAKGDYRYKSASNQVLFGQQQINMFLAAFNSSTTWVGHCHLCHLCLSATSNLV